MKKKCILVDIDNTLNSLSSHFIVYLNKLGYEFNQKYMCDYDLSKGIISKNNDQIKIMNTIFTDDYFWKTIPTLENSYQGLSYLNDNYTMYIASVPYTEHNKNVKVSWLESNYPFINTKQVIFGDAKWDLSFADIIIEDKPLTLKKANEKGFITIKKYQEYNKNVDTNYTFYDWNEIITIMERYEKSNN